MPELKIGSVFAGHRIEAIAGRGGMGVVYRAIQLDLNRPVALKLISPDMGEDAAFRERFKRESQLAAAIEHPNILPVYQAGEVDDRLFLTMRFVPGTDLGRLIAEEGRLEPARAVRTLTQIAAALDAAHASGLVHRDVKPANILLTAEADEHAYLTDFGLTKRAASDSGLTRTGQFVGTLDYVSPEQIEGEPADARSDVYSLGCVLFHALTGSRPYEREGEMAKMWAHVNDPVPAVTALIPDASAEVDDVLRRALAKEPAERFPSAGDLARAARAAFDQPVSPAPERSVAAGDAAPGATAPMETPADALTAETKAVEPGDEATDALGGAEQGAPPAEGGRPAGPAGPSRTTGGGPPARVLALAGAGALALVVVLVVVFAGVLGGDGGGGEGERAASPQRPELPPAPVRTSGWRALPDAPSAREFAATAVAGDAIWVIGGLTPGGATSKVEVYDPASRSWRTGPSLPIPVHHAMAIPYQGAPVVLGGSLPEGGERRAGTSDRVFALRGERWAELPRLPEPRAAGGASVVGETIVVAGGEGADGELLAATSRFDGARWRRGAPLPTPRADLAVATEGRYVYAAGGRTSPRGSSGAFERYDPRAGTWRRLPALPTPRAGLGIAIVADQVAAVGGSAGDRVLGTAEAYDIASGTWARLPGLPTPLRGLGVESYERALYVTTGATGAGGRSPSALGRAMRVAPGPGG